MSDETPETKGLSTPDDSAWRALMVEWDARDRESAPVGGTRSGRGARRLGLLRDTLVSTIRWPGQARPHRLGVHRPTARDDTCELVTSTS